MNLTNFKWDQDADGIVTIFWDVPNRSMNVLTGSAISDLLAVADKVSTDATIKGLIITSGKKTGFCAGAALDEMEGNTQAAAKSPEEALARQYQGVMAFHQAFRKLETCGKPVAAAINGLDTRPVPHPSSSVRPPARCATRVQNDTSRRPSVRAFSQS